MNKIDIISGAYSKLRISGLTVIPSKEDLSLALIELESFMAELFASSNLDVGYIFEEVPDSNSPSGVAIEFRNMMVCNLATRLITDFNKVTPPTLQAQASQSLSKAIGVVAINNLRQVHPSRRSPRGSGSNRYEYFGRFSRPIPLPPNKSSTNRIIVSEIQNYIENFSAYLAGETISSYEILSDIRLNIVTHSSTDTEILYTVEALKAGQNAPFQQVQIAITTSGGREEVRTINFQVEDLAKVG